ncbi:MAG: Flp pilus assembly protein CpaB [Vicinamibacterales bacterium]
MRSGTRTLVVVAVAVVVASLATLAMYRAVERIPVREVEVASTQVVVASRPLPTGTAVTAADVRLVAWPARAPITGAHGSPDGVVGRGLLRPVVENEPLTDTALAPREAGSGLPPTIPPGMRAIAVQVNEVIGVAGFVVPGTRVDVVATLARQDASMSRVVVSNVEVLAAGTRFDQERSQNGQPIPTTVVTLLVMPADAERIALAAVEGRLQLALRNPLDQEPTLTEGARIAQLTGAPLPPPPAPVRAPRVAPAAVPAKVEAPRPYVVETIRAAKRADEVVK